jgi:chromosome segregation ATPase
MVHDDDADGFLGTVDIRHSGAKDKSQAKKKNALDDELAAANAENEHPVELPRLADDEANQPVAPAHHSEEDAQIVELEKKISELEAEISEAIESEHTLVEKIAHLEKELRDGSTAGDRFLRIAEEG